MSALTPVLPTLSCRALGDGGGVQLTMHPYTMHHINGIIGHRVQDTEVYRVLSSPLCSSNILQSPDVNLRRMMCLFIKQIAETSDPAQT